MRLDLQVQDEPEVVKHVLAAIRNLFKLMGWDEEDMFRALLVADEMIQNGVDASNKLGGYHNGGHEVRVGIVMDNNRMQLTVVNDGEGFISDREVWTRRDILRECTPDITGERGRGLSIMAQYSDQLSIRRASDRQIVSKAIIRCKGAGRGDLG